jgi:hypothetical protein
MLACGRLALLSVEYRIAAVLFDASARGGAVPQDFAAAR